MYIFLDSNQSLLEMRLPHPPVTFNGGYIRPSKSRIRVFTSPTNILTKPTMPEPNKHAAATEAVDILHEIATILVLCDRKPPMNPPS